MVPNARPQTVGPKHPSSPPTAWSQTMVPNYGPKHAWSQIVGSQTYRPKGGPKHAWFKRYGLKQLAPNTHGPKPVSQTRMVLNCGSQTAHDPKRKRWVPKTHGPKRWSQTWSQTMLPNGVVPNSGPGHPCCPKHPLVPNSSPKHP